MVETDEQPGGVPEQKADQEWLQTYLDKHEGEIEPGTRIEPPSQGSPFRLLILVLAVLAVAGAALFLTKTKGLQLEANAKPNDLGQGVVAESGLRGHLVTEWKNKTVYYQLKIEPIDARSDAGFAKVVEASTQPLFVNLRVLDAAGEALCGKQVMLPAGGAVTKGSDAFKAIAGARGRAESLWAEGTIPCSPDQYAKFDYWNFATNFPTMADQDRMLGLPVPEVAEQEATAAPQQEAPAATPTPTMTPTPARKGGASRHRSVKPKKPQSSFYLEGDDHVSAFEPGRNVLTVGPDKNFVLLRPGDVATAQAWADDSLLVHYTCDQRGNCALRHGGGAEIPARANN
jgi:hypothetical protein